MKNSMQITVTIPLNDTIRRGVKWARNAKGPASDVETHRYFERQLKECLRASMQHLHGIMTDDFDVGYGPYD